MDTWGAFCFPLPFEMEFSWKMTQKKIPTKNGLFLGIFRHGSLSFCWPNFCLFRALDWTSKTQDTQTSLTRFNSWHFFPNKIILYFPTWKGTQSGLTTRLKKRSFGTIQIQILFTICPKLLDQFPRRSLWFTGNLISFCHKLLAAKSIQRNFVTPNPNLEDGRFIHTAPKGIWFLKEANFQVELN